jgi:hypothetical protein
MGAAGTEYVFGYSAMAFSIVTWNKCLQYPVDNTPMAAREPCKRILYSHDGSIVVGVAVLVVAAVVEIWNASLTNIMPLISWKKFPAYFAFKTARCRRVAFLF